MECSEEIKVKGQKLKNTNPLNKTSQASGDGTRSKGQRSKGRAFTEPLCLPPLGLRNVPPTTERSGIRADADATSLDTAATGGRVSGPVRQNLRSGFPVGRDYRGINPTLTGGTKRSVNLKRSLGFSSDGRISRNVDVPRTGTENRNPAGRRHDEGDALGGELTSQRGQEDGRGQRSRLQPT